MSLTFLFIFYRPSLSGASLTFLKVSVYVYLVSVILKHYRTQARDAFSLTSAIFRDHFQIPKFSRLVATLYETVSIG